MSPAHVIRSIWGKVHGDSSVNNVTMFGLTVHCALECKILRSWYRSSTRTYVHLLDIHVDRSEMVSMYICAGIVQIKHSLSVLRFWIYACARCGTTHPPHPRTSHGGLRAFHQDSGGIS